MNRAGMRALKILIFLMLAWIPISTIPISTAAVNATAATLEICNGGLLGIEGGYTTNVSDMEVHYGDTIFVRVADGQGYSILVDGVNKGEDKAYFHVDKSSGTITIETSPATQTITLNVTGYDGYMNYVAGYLLFIKQNCPALTNTLAMDTFLWAVILFPLGVAIGIKVAILILRAVH